MPWSRTQRQRVPPALVLPGSQAPACRRPRAPAGRVARALGNAGVQRLLRSAVAAPTRGPDESLLHTLRSRRGGGRPLPHRVEQVMASAFDHDFSRVRVHTDDTAHRLSERLDARAFTVGGDVYFRRGAYAPESAAGRGLLAHELAHVVQQSGVASSTPTGVSEPSDPTERAADAAAAHVAALNGLHHAQTPGRAGSAMVARQAEPGRRPGERVVGVQARDQPARTVVVIHVVGHASPRWRSAGSPAAADRRNAALARQRGQAVRRHVERQVRTLLAGRSLTFEYDYTPADPTSEPADVVIGSESRGSAETLVEAGPRGRAANDPDMRRVDVRVDLHRATTTAVTRDVERVERRSGATTRWAIWVGAQSGVAIGPKAGYIMVQLRNRLTGVTATYHGHYSGGGIELGAEVARTGPPSFESFEVPQPMGFSDFDAARFVITSAGVALGVGVGIARFRFAGFNWGHPTPRDAIAVGGLSFGGIGISLGSSVYGAMYLQGRPREFQQVTVRESRTERFRSEAQERTTQRVHFATGSDRISAAEVRDLDAYLARVTGAVR